MNTLGHAHIDYFSLDVERVEMIILQSIDWDKLDGSLSKYTYFSVITQLKDKYQPN